MIGALMSGVTVTDRVEFINFLANQHVYQEARKAWIEHLQTCHDCDVDRDCFACAIQGETRLEHTCNCSIANGPGFLLKQAYYHGMSKAMLAYKDREKEEK